MSLPIIPLILCGGAGTRLWPASREGRPKQFLRLLGQYSSFQETVRRVANRELFARPIIVTNVNYRFLVAEQLAEVAVQADILLEPARRNSAPAIAAGTAFALTRGDDPIVVALAADHVVTDPIAFAAACGNAKSAAEQGRIVTFGVRPDHPATDYGYICAGAALDGNVFAVEKFVEKPTEDIAARYVRDGYLWNSGNFMFRAGVFLDEYRKFEPDSAEAVGLAVARLQKDIGFLPLDARSFEQARDSSVDYAVMEKTDRAAVVPVSFGWSDVGSWQAVWQLTSKDAAQNATRGNVVFVDAGGSYVASDKALVALLGVDNLVVVASEDAILIADRDRIGDMRKLVERVRAQAPAVTEEHLTVYRPWGSYQSLERGERYQVKRIIVNPGGRLSLQRHHHRAEHWVVVRGTARVTVGDEVKMVHENQSTFIPVGTSHRLENPGKIALELIEVQSGSYLGEDDIERMDDDYHRA